MTFAIGVGFAVPAAGAVAQTPAGDSVQASGSTNTWSGIDISAQSGPSGENPSGHVTVSGLGGQPDPVTCLQVNGNTAYVGFRNSFLSANMAAKLVDNVPGYSNGVDRFDFFFTNGTSINCGFQSNLEEPFSGNLVVVDAPPLPTDNQQCKNEGWRRFSVFKNQGDCVSYIATGGRNVPGAP
jgi:hypothetical protein